MNKQCCKELGLIQASGKKKCILCIKVSAGEFKKKLYKESFRLTCPTCSSALKIATTGWLRSEVTILGHVLNGSNKNRLLSKHALLHWTRNREPVVLGLNTEGCLSFQLYVLIICCVFSGSFARNVFSIQKPPENKVSKSSCSFFNTLFPEILLST